jgi:hypothetical protein
LDELDADYRRFCDEVGFFSSVTSDSNWFDGVLLATHYFYADEDWEAERVYRCVERFITEAK